MMAVIEAVKCNNCYYRTHKHTYTK